MDPATTSHPDDGCGVSATLTLIKSCRTALACLRDQAGSATGADLEECLAALGELSLGVDAAEVAVVAEALLQGQHLAGPAPQPAAGWVAMTSRRYTRTGAQRLATLAEAVTPATITRKAGALSPDGDGALLGEAILDASAPIGSATLAFREMTRLAPDLNTEDNPGLLETIWAGYATVARTGDTQQIKGLRQSVDARYGEPERHRLSLRSPLLLASSDWCATRTTRTHRIVAPTLPETGCGTTG